MLKLLLGGWYGYAAAALAGAAFAVVATAIPYKLIIAKMQRDSAKAELASTATALAQFKADAAAINGAAQAFTAISANLDKDLSRITREFRNEIAAHPLPADCRPDAVRLRKLSEAIAAINSTAGLQSGPAVPARP